MKVNAACWVVVVRADGSSLTGATVSMSPNQRISEWRRSLFGVDKYDKYYEGCSTN